MKCDNAGGGDGNCMDPSKIIVKLDVQALHVLVTANDRRYTERFTAQEMALAAALATTSMALQKSEYTSEKRFDAVNEFRASLADQSMLTLTRSEAQQCFTATDIRLSKIEEFISQQNGAHSRSADNNRIMMMVVGVGGIVIAVISLLVTVLKGH